MPMYLRETVQDRPDPLLNSTHFFSVVDRTLTHFFWSTGWEVLSKSLSHSSLIETHFIGGIKLLNPLYYRIGTFIAHIAHFYGMLSRILNYKYTT